MLRQYPRMEIDCIAHYHHLGDVGNEMSEFVVNEMDCIH
jgi:hypothetical protein